MSRCAAVWDSSCWTPKVSLINFASFLEQRGAAHITITLAMEWAQQNKTAHLSEWARRLSFVRGFARHWSAYDSQTEVPPIACYLTGQGVHTRTCTATMRSVICFRPPGSCRRRTGCGVRPITACWGCWR